MASKITKVITVSIDDDYIKMAEISETGKNLHVLWAESIPTPTTTYEDGEIVDVEKMSRTLKQIVYKNRRYAKHIAFTVAGSKIANKEIIIPSIPDKKIPSMIQANATEYFPIDVEEYVFTHTVLERFTDEEEKMKKLRLMVIAAPESLIDSYYLLADRLELKLASIDYAGNSTVQMIKRQVDEKPNIVIQVNENNTVVNILKNGVLLLQRSIPYGRTVVVKSVMDNMNVEEPEARKLIKKDRMIHNSFDGDPVTNSLRYMIGNLTRIVDYYTSRNQDNPLEKAFLITNGEEMVGLTRLISSELNMNTTMISDLMNISVEKDFQMPETNLVDFIANLGSVIDPIDLRSKRFVETTKKKEGKNNGLALIIGTIVVAGLFVLYPAYQYKQAFDEKQSLQAEVDKVIEVESIVDNYYNAKDKYEDVLAFVKLSSTPNDDTYDLILKIEEIMPSNISVTALTISEVDVQIAGVGSSKLDVAKFLEELYELENIYDVVVEAVSETKAENGAITEVFTVKFSFDYFPEVESAEEETSKEVK